MKINWTNTFRYLCPVVNTSYNRDVWVCFGTLLTYVRDQGKFKKEDDIDLGVFFETFEPMHFLNMTNSRGWDLDVQIIDDFNKKPLYMSLKPQRDTQTITGDIHVDIFAWREWEGYYWHTYDMNMDRPSNGKLRQYTFKGVPKWMFDGGMIPWENVADTGMHLWIPLKYGSLMDYWYPPKGGGDIGWLKPRQCVSEAEAIIRVKSCSAFKTGNVEWLKRPTSV